MFDFLPPVSAERINGSPLTHVIAQVRFPSQQLLATPAGVSQFHDTIASDYPRLLSEPQTILTAGPAGTSTTEVPQWRMTDLRAAWSVVVSPESLSIEISEYTSWSDMRQRLNDALVRLTDMTRLRVRERAGLRYVNQVPLNAQGNLEGLVRPSLLGLLIDDGWRRNLDWSMSQTLVSDGNVKLHMRHGTGSLVVGNSTNYVIDIDCYDDVPAVFDLDLAVSHLDKLNDVVLRGFYACMEKGFHGLITPGGGESP